jgi:hypothetical protein
MQPLESSRSTEQLAIVDAAWRDLFIDHDYSGDAGNVENSTEHNDHPKQIMQKTNYQQQSIEYLNNLIFQHWSNLGETLMDDQSWEEALDAFEHVVVRCVTCYELVSNNVSFHYFIY